MMSHDARPEPPAAGQASPLRVLVADDQELVAAGRVAPAGDALLAPSVTRRLIEAFARRPAEAAPAPSRLASLTPRERDILLLLARGQSNTEIARALVVSEATVKTHVAHL